MSKQLLPVLSLVLCCLLAACSRGGPMAKMSQNELLKRYQHCIIAKPTAPAYATACGNIERECKMREKEQGLAICVLKEKKLPVSKIDKEQ